MAFQLFVQPTAGESMARGIEQLGAGIGHRIEQERDWAAEAKAFKKHAEAVNELMGGSSPYVGMDFDGMSNRDMAEQGRQSQQLISEFMAFQQQKSQQALQQAQMQHDLALANKYATENDIAKYLFEKTKAGDKTANITDPTVAALVNKKTAVDAKVDQLVSAGYGDDLKQYINAAKVLQDGHKKMIDAVTKQQQAALPQNDPYGLKMIGGVAGVVGRNALYGLQNVSGAGLLSRGFGWGQNALADSILGSLPKEQQFPEQTQEEIDATRLLARLNANPEKKAAYADIIKSYLSGEPVGGGQKPAGNNMVTTSERIKMGPATITQKPVK